MEKRRVDDIVVVVDDDGTTNPFAVQAIRKQRSKKMRNMMEETCDVPLAKIIAVSNEGRDVPF